MASRNKVEIIIDAKDNASRTIGGVSRNLKTAGENISNAGSQLTSFMAPVALALGGAAYMALDFGDAMTNVGAVLGKTRAEMQPLNDEILALGSNSVFGPQAVAEAFYDVVGGVGDASQHMAILTMAMDTATAGSADLGATTNALIAVMNSYASSGLQASTASDILTQTVGMGVGTMDEFAAALPAVTGLANSLGISFADVASATSYLTTQGNTASQATTQLGAMMSAMLNPNTQMKEAIAELGYETGAAAVESLGLVGAIEAIGNTATAQEAGGLAPLLGSMEAVRGATALTGDEFEAFDNRFQGHAVVTRDVADDFLVLGRSMEGGFRGATAAAKEIQMEDPANQLGLLTSQAHGLGVTLGNALTPILIDLTTRLTPIVAGITDWITANPQATQGILLFTGALIVLGPALSTIGTAITIVTTATGLMSGAWGIATTVAGGLVTAMGAITGGAAAVITAVFGMAAPFVAMATAIGMAVAAGIKLIETLGMIQGSAAVAQEAIDPLLASGDLTPDELFIATQNAAGAQGFGMFSDLAARFAYSQLNVPQASMGDNVAANVNESLGIPSRDTGGPGAAGQPYLIGTGAQPELFVPSTPGTFIPNAGNMGMTINLNVPAETAGNGNWRQNAESFADLIGQRLKQRGAYG